MTEQTPVRVIDHHPLRPDLPPDWAVRMEPLGATTTLLVEELPSSRSPAYGKPFLQVLQEAGGFYQVDPGLFAPAEVTLVSLASGASFHAGALDEIRLAQVFQGGA